MSLPISSLFVTENKCIICEKITKKKCSKCQLVFYCSVQCQRTDWTVGHKNICAKKKGAKTVQDRMIDYLQQIKLKGTFSGYEMANDFYYSKNDSLKGEFLNLLPDSAEKTLMMLMIFAYPENQQKAFDEMGSIPFVKIIKEEKKCNIGNPNDCSFFVFGEEDWFKSEGKGKNQALKKSLFDDYPNTMKFLARQGYTPTSKPKVDDLVVYSTHVYPSPHSFSPERQKVAKVSHYGKICEINEDGSVMVRSKFGHFHTYQHRLELIPYFYGNNHTFLTKSEA